MFTGLVQEMGRVIRVTPGAEGLRLAVEAPEVSREAAIGDSVSVNGTCLTAVSISPPIVEFDAVRETVERSTLASLRPGAHVNLEQSLRAGDRMGGHIVQGHVDGIGVVRQIARVGTETRFRFGAPAEVMMFIVAKGSITVDGISLTVADLGDDWFEVAVIPHSLQHTTLGGKSVGGTVNLETDIIGKYVFKYMGKAAPGSDDRLLHKLAESGFLD